MKPDVHCLKCGKRATIHKTGGYVLEKIRGNQPYKLWCCDIYQCVKCGQYIPSGFADRPEQPHQPNFAERLALAKKIGAEKHGAYFEVEVE